MRIESWLSPPRLLFFVSLAGPAIACGTSAPGPAGDGGSGAASSSGAAGSSSGATGSSSGAGSSGGGTGSSSGTAGSSSGASSSGGGAACATSTDCTTGDSCLFQVGSCTATGECLSPASVGPVCNIVVVYCGCDGGTVGGICGTTYAEGPTTGHMAPCGP